MKKLPKLIIALVVLLAAVTAVALAFHKSTYHLSVHLNQNKTAVVQIYKGSWNKATGKIEEKDSSLVGEEKVGEKTVDGSSLAQFDLPTGSYFVYVPTKYGEFDDLPANVSLVQDTSVVVEN